MPATRSSDSLPCFWHSLHATIFWWSLSPQHTPHTPHRKNTSLATSDIHVWVKALPHRPYSISHQLQLIPNHHQKLRKFKAQPSVDTGFMEKNQCWRLTQWLNFSSSWMPLTAMFILRTFGKKWKIDHVFGVLCNPCQLWCWEAKTLPKVMSGEQKHKGDFEMEFHSLQPVYTT